MYATKKIVFIANYCSNFLRTKFLLKNIQKLYKTVWNFVVSGGFS
jgi:hypothetical protein